MITTNKSRHVKRNNNYPRIILFAIFGFLLLYRRNAYRYRLLCSISTGTCTGVHSQQRYLLSSDMQPNADDDSDPNPNREAHSELQKSFYRSCFTWYALRMIIVVN
jgi:hypothetical protein